MSDETLQDNPFAAPAESLPVVETEATDDWYELRGDTLVCRSSLRLPMYCLVTGEACPESAPLNFPLYWQPGFSTSRIGIVLVVIFVVVLWAIGCIVLGQILASNGAPIPVMIVYSMVAIGIPITAGIMAVRRSARRMKIQVTAFLSPSRHRARRFSSWLGVLIMIPLMVLEHAGVLPNGLGGFWFLPFVILNYIIQRVWLPGMRLKLKPREDGLYEVTGFSPVFLELLRSQAARNEERVAV